MKRLVFIALLAACGRTPEETVIDALGSIQTKDEQGVARAGHDPGSACAGPCLKLPAR